VREVAEQFAGIFSKKARFVNRESDTALLSNPAKICAQLGPPSTSLKTMIERIADWVRNGGRYLDKPTHFEVRDGAY
jgi:hypothetical protein